MACVEKGITYLGVVEKRWLFQDKRGKMVKSKNLLFELLNNNDPKVRKAVINTFRQLKDERAIEPLNKMIRESNDRIKILSAIDALAAIGKPAVEPLIKLLDVGFPVDTDAVIRHLGALKDERAIDPLAKLVGIYGTEVVLALNQIGGEKIIAPLIEALKSEDAGTASRALLSLEHICIGEKAVRLLLVAASTGDSKMVRLAKKIITESKDENVLEPLTEALKDDNDLIREISAECIYYKSRTQFKDKLIESQIVALKDKDSNVRKFSAKTLGTLNDIKAVEPLILALEDKYKEVKIAVIDALGEIGGSTAEKKILSLLNDNDIDIRFESAVALGKLANPKVIDILLKYFFERPEKDLIGIVIPVLTGLAAVSNLSDEIITLIKDVPTCEIVRKPDYFFDHFTYYVSINAVRSLCNIKTAVASNILHLISKMNDAFIEFETGDTSHLYSGEMDGVRSNFDEHRNIAAAELESRGNPPYNPEAYLQ